MSGIKLIVESIGSKSDIYGNRYWFSVVTSAKTGKSITFTTPSHGNTTSLLRDNWEWDEIHGSESDLPIREWDRRAKSITLHNSCHDAEILEKIKELTV